VKKTWRQLARKETIEAAASILVDSLKKMTFVNRGRNPAVPKAFEGQNKRSQ
jgi:hypothetical protein